MASSASILAVSLAIAVSRIAIFAMSSGEAVTGWGMASSGAGPPVVCLLVKYMDGWGWKVDGLLKAMVMMVMVVMVVWEERSLVKERKSTDPSPHKIE